jgi:hypothetical protein
MRTDREYRIATIADFLAVPAEKQADLLRDFRLWLDHARSQADDVSRELGDLLGGRFSFDTTYFTWIDDGIAGVSALDLRDDDSDRVVRLGVARPEEKSEIGAQVAAQQNGESDG